ncbi:N-acetyltransferase family protein [Thalassobius sp. MITS945101]|uniref:GNAT family N-acetyltransferase n=1 Tax=Thalassobius sp. MITS945101 TaxID=3096994 RepID=UPI00399B1F76
MAVIRDACAEDAEAIAAIWNQIIRDTTVTFTTSEKTSASIAADIAARQAAGRGFLVAEHQGTVLGMACYGPFRAGPGYRMTMEHTIYLSEAAKGQGLGRQLLQALERHARTAGHHVLIGAVSGENAAGISFHKALGYAEVGRLPDAGHKFGRFLDMVLLQKTL